MHEELRKLRELEAVAKEDAKRSARTFKQIHRERVRLESILGEGGRKKGGTLVMGPWIAVLIAATWRKWPHASSAIGGAAIASGATAAVLIPQISSPPDHGDAAQQPAVTAPAPTRPDKSPTPVKSRRPAKPGPAPTTPPALPLPSPPVSTPPTGTPLVGTTLPTPVKPPKVHPLHPLHPLHPTHPVHPTPGGPRGHGKPRGDETGTAQEPCRIHLIGLDLLCGRLAR